MAPAGHSVRPKDDSPAGAEEEEAVDKDPQSTTSNAEISLASVLNILWRRRLIVVALPLLGMIAGFVYGQVVTPLYLATATVRPGITSFGPRGGGGREWRLKDVERWFESGMYRPWTAAKMDRAPSLVPLIRASFIQRGLQNTQRGEIITLTCLDASRENAVEGIEAAIEAFSHFAMADTTSNSIALTKRGLHIQMDELRRYQRVLAARVDSLNTDLAVARVESLQIDDEEIRLAYDVSLLEDRRRVIAERITALEDQVEQLRANRQELITVRQRVRDRLSGAQGDLPSGARPEVALTDAEVLRGLVASSADLEDQIVRVSARADSLRQADKAAQRESEYLERRNETLIAYDRAEIGSRMRTLRQARDFGVPNAIASVELRVMEKQGQLAALSPIEPIGDVQVTDRPVRPRKKRAITILTLMGLVGGLAGAFVFDYVWNNRKSIFRS